MREQNRALLTLRPLKALGMRGSRWTISGPAIVPVALRAFPFDKIKIDGSFIRAVHNNAQGAAIVRSVLGLGRGLGLAVVAEGVETDDELSFLAQGAAAASAQGYLMGRPAADRALRRPHPRRRGPERAAAAA